MSLQPCPHLRVFVQGAPSTRVALWTLQRRGDGGRFGAQQRKSGTIHIWHAKNGKMTWVPESAQLTNAIDAMPAVGLTTFLVTEFGKPFTPAGLGNWFRVRCNAAGLPCCSLHGLRKTTARRFAELGRTQQ